MSDNRDNVASLIEGTITMTDGSTSKFQIGTDGGWSQWGADQRRVGRSVPIMEALARALLEDDLLTSDSDEDPDAEDEAARLAVLTAVVRSSRDYANADLTDEDLRDLDARLSESFGADASDMLSEYFTAHRFSPDDMAAIAEDATELRCLANMLRAGRIPSFPTPSHRSYV